MLKIRTRSMRLRVALTAAVACLLCACQALLAQQSLSQDDLLRGAGSRAYNIQYKPDSVIPLLEETLRDPTIPPGSNKFLVAKTALAVAYATDGQYNRSSLLLLSCLSGFEAMQDDGAAGFVHQWLSYDYKMLERYDEALVHARLAVRLFDKANQPIGLCDALNALGNALVKESAFDTAYACFLKGAEVGREAGYGLGAARSLNSAAHLLLQWQQFDEAIARYAQALEFARHADGEPTAPYLNNLAAAYLAKGDTALARQNVNFALDSLGSSPDRGLLMNVFNNVARISAATGDFQRAYAAKDTVQKLALQMAEQRSASKIEEIEASYKAQIGLKDDAIEQDEQIRSELEQARLTDRRNVIIGAIITALLVGFLGYLAFRYKRESTKLAAEQKSRIDLMNALLDDKVKERTDALSRVNAELDHLLYRSSHDLRAPINQLLGLVTLLDADTDIHELRKLVGLVRQSMDSLNNLNISICEAGDIRMHATKVVPIVLPEFVGKLTDDLLLTQVNCRFQPPSGCSLHGDNYLLRIALSEIIRNSAEARQGSPVSITFSCTQVKGQLELRIADDGRGIPSEIHAKVFDLFSKGHNRPGHHGLGLYKARLAVQKMGGTLELEKSDATGTTLRMTLPMPLLA